MKRPLFIIVFIGAAVLVLAVALAVHFRLFSSSGVTAARPAASPPPPIVVAASPSASPNRSAQERAARYNNDLKSFTAPRPQK